MLRAREVTGLVIGLSVIGLSSHALAQEKAKTGFELGARVSYGIPLGEATGASGDDLSHAIQGMIPLQLDIGYRVIPHLMVGAYVGYGFGFLGDDVSAGCDAARAQGIGVDCSTHDVRLGAQLQGHILPGEKVDPWLGLGFGYEWLTIHESASLAGQSASISASIHGWEFFNLQAGVDFSPTEGVGIGPFATFTLGQYDRVSADVESGGVTQGAAEDVSNKALHEWLLLGVRGTFVL